MPWSLAVVDASGGRGQANGTLTVRARAFRIQRLTLPRHMVDLDPAVERRAEAESARLNALYDTVTAERLWRGPFVRPVAVDTAGDGFGARRIINGKPRRPHAGRDYAAERGTPVVATNRGRVALVADFFFPGRMVALDHGLGLHTLYMHLERVDVEEGMLIDRGERLGVVGATGRATGPHLHFGAQLGRARIDPETLLGTRLDE
jgi:murein DD-endopeptidase MepM/ murein hydrolase activator NlpD